MKNIVMLLVAFILSGCVTNPSFRVSDSDLIYEMISAYDHMTDSEKEVDLLIYRPKKIDRERPAVIFLSGCRGTHREIHATLVREFLSDGIVVAELKSIAAYGEQCTRRPTLTGLNNAGYAFLSKDLLVEKGLASAENVALIGTSHGGWTATYASKMDIARYAYTRLKNKDPFAAIVAMVPWCDRFRAVDTLVKTPLLILGGDADTWTPVEQCVELFKGDSNVTIHIYKDATHAYDYPGSVITQGQRGAHRLTYHREATLDSISKSSEFIKKYLKLSNEKNILK